MVAATCAPPWPSCSLPWPPSSATSTFSQSPSRISSRPRKRSRSLLLPPRLVLLPRRARLRTLLPRRRPRPRRRFRPRLRPTPRRKRVLQDRFHQSWRAGEELDPEEVLRFGRQAARSCAAAGRGTLRAAALALHLRAGAHHAAERRTLPGELQRRATLGHGPAACAGNDYFPLLGQRHRCRENLSASAPATSSTSKPRSSAMARPCARWWSGPPAWATWRSSIRLPCCAGRCPHPPSSPGRSATGMTCRPPPR